MSRQAPEVGVVLVTRDRRDSVLATLDRLEALPGKPRIVVVDNASTDGSVAAIRARHPGVDLLALERNRGAFARNLGVDRVGTPVVAFCDDDSWWAPDALGKAAEIFRRWPRLGLLAARILVGAERRLDPVSAEMRGPVPLGLAGPRIRGFLACGSLVRRDAFRDGGGFCERFLIGSEEELLAIDLRVAGWDLCYADGVVAVHDPHGADRGPRGWLIHRNALWTAWLRKPLRLALHDTAVLAWQGRCDRNARRAATSALRGLPWAISERRPAPAWLLREWGR